VAILHTSAETPQGLEERGLARGSVSALGGRGTIVVTDSPRRITAPHGISPLERDLLTEGLDSMRRKGPLAFISVEAPAEPIVREISRSLKNVLALRQRRAGMRRGALWAEVRETKARDGSPKPGAHIVAPMPSAPGRDGLIDAVNNSSVYGRNVFAEPVTDVDGLKGYLLKEATPQAAFRTGVRRVKGSHPLAEGGDRVRLSPALRDSLIRAERVTQYQRTYAARRSRTAVNEPLNSDGQGLLFDCRRDSDVEQVGAATHATAQARPVTTNHVRVL
jgi:hypothetical protein